MANRAYLRVWTREFSETTLIAQFARFLATAPLSSSEPAFKELVVQPIDATELSLAEWDLKDLGYGAAEVAALAIQHLHPDSAYIAAAKWDLWSFDAEILKWTNKPEPLVLTCHGPEYDGAIAASEGHFAADLGFEHFFTGHGGLLAPGAASNPFASSDHPLEHSFRQWMSAAGNLKEYHAKTRENIQQLFRWVESIEQALPVERSQLSSEGEENFEARLDAILAQR
ncbi:MAG TPA: hypothetical protein VN087_05010 [Verrucomicrobiae bacterium]|jgi:hypothetical protein|nr:hypothetical protein [Verrucomicrobiae bacterium]